MLLGPRDLKALFRIRVHLMIDCLCGDFTITTWNRLAFVWKSSKEKCYYINNSARAHTCTCKGLTWVLIILELNKLTCGLHCQFATVSKHSLASGLLQVLKYSPSVLSALSGAHSSP